jgi:hypothetical protein
MKLPDWKTNPLKTLMKPLQSTLTLLVLLAVSAHAGEALIRSDFESGALDEWLVVPYAQPMPAVVKGDAHGGDQALKLDRDSADANPFSNPTGVYREFMAYPDKGDLTVSFAAKNAGGGRLAVRVRSGMVTNNSPLIWWDGANWAESPEVFEFPTKFHQKDWGRVADRVTNFTQTGNTTQIVDSGEWEKVTLEIPLNQGESLYAIEFYQLAAGGVSLIDDVVIEQKP